jgi:hypothetical protein
MEKINSTSEASLVAENGLMKMAVVNTSMPASSLSNDLAENQCTVLPSSLCCEKMDSTGLPPDSEAEDTFRCGDSIVELGDSDQDSKEDQDADEASTQRPVWEVVQPSEYYLNKLDGWSLKVNASTKYDSPNAESLPISDIESWLKENLSDAYISRSGSPDRESNRRKSKVRWADIESRLQSLDLMLDSSMEASFSAGTLSS